MHVEPSTQVGYQTAEHNEEGSSATELIRSMALSSAELWHDILLRLDEVQRNQAALTQAVAQLGSMVETWMLTGPAPSLVAPPAPAELPRFEPPATTEAGFAQVSVEAEATEAALEIDGVESEASAPSPAQSKRRRFLRPRTHGRRNAGPDPTLDSQSEVQLGIDTFAPEAPALSGVEPEASSPSPAKSKRRRRHRKHDRRGDAPEATSDDGEVVSELVTLVPPAPLAIQAPLSPAPELAAEPEPVVTFEPEPVVTFEPEPVVTFEPEPVAATAPEFVVTDAEVVAAQQASTGEALCFLADSLSALAAPDDAPKAPAPLVYTPASAETALVTEPPVPPVTDLTAPSVTALAPLAAPPAVVVDPPAPFTLDPVQPITETAGAWEAAPVLAGTGARPVEDIHTSASLASEILGSALPQREAPAEPAAPMPLVISEDLTLRGKRHKKRLQFRPR